MVIYMLIFNQDKLMKILKDFYELTHATISIWDPDFNQLWVYPSAHKRLCRAVKENPCGNRNCFRSDKSICINATKANEPHIVSCHAGLLDVAVPVRYDHKIIAYIIFGQIRDFEEKYVNLQNVKKLCKNYNINEKTIEEYYKEVPVLTHEQISAAANFLSMCTVYLYVSQSIKIEKNALVSSIDSYITKNITKPISVEELCRWFNISQNKLYQISHKYFNTSIANYIALKKINLAKHYLTTGQLSVSQISEKIGFADYNYFIRKFKKQTGYTPLAYRKNFPHNIL